MLFHFLCVAEDGLLFITDIIAQTFVVIECGLFAKRCGRGGWSWLTLSEFVRVFLDRGSVYMRCMNSCPEACMGISDNGLAAGAESLN